ncbi:hypothetical protein QAD02_018316 [Eretmocerus hayati]|uniref:Uncharacterized protein n=1 Tax=Eretmocerus hayati TaxID=131215 RepID=A0ACC2PG22_9HYME|nr:hypothetical protein QAD02_018316 [Eretmocerus hayati]
MEVLNEYSLAVILVIISCMEPALVTVESVGMNKVISERMTSIPDGPLEFYYPRDLLDHNGFHTFIGCKVGSSPASISCYVISGPSDLSDLRVCPKILSFNRNEILNINEIEIFRPNGNTTLITWVTLPIANQEQVGDISSRYIAVINLPNESVKLKKLEIKRSETRVSFVVPFKDFYEVTYCKSNTTIRRRYNFNHEDILYWSAHMNLGYCQRNKSSGVLILPSPESKMSALQDKRHIIIEELSADSVMISEITQRAEKNLITPVSKFSPNRLSNRYGFLTLCGEFSLDNSSIRQCEQYNSELTLKMRVTLTSLESLENIVTVESVENGGFLMLIEKKFSKFNYNFTRIHPDMTEEVIFENIESEYRLTIPAPRIEISYLNDMYCIHWFTEIFLTTKLYGPVTKSKITRGNWDEVRPENIQLYRLRETKVLVTWLVLKTMDSLQHLWRHVAIVNLVDSEIKMKEFYIGNGYNHTSSVVPFHDSYEIIYQGNEKTLRNRYTLQHEEKTDSISCPNLNTFSQGSRFSRILIHPNPDSDEKMSSLYENRYLIIEEFQDIANLSYGTRQGDKYLITTVNYFSPDRLSTRYGNLTVCDESGGEGASLVECRQYDEEFQIRMKFYPSRLFSIAKIAAIGNLRGGGLLMLKKHHHSRLQHQLVKFDRNGIEEVLAEDISFDCVLLNPAPRIEIWKVGRHDYCVYRTCGKQMEIENGIMTEFEIVKNCITK